MRTYLEETNAMNNIYSDELPDSPYWKKNRVLNRSQSLKSMDYCMANSLIYVQIRLQSHLGGYVELYGCLRQELDRRFGNITRFATSIPAS